MSRNKNKLDLSISHIDGSHTPVYKGGEKSEYQGRKKRCTTNALLFSDNQGIPLAMSEPQAGNHADLYEIDKRIDEIVSQLTDASIAIDGLFCNLDAGFDAKNSEVPCFSAALHRMYVLIQETVVKRKRIGCTMRRCMRRDGKSNGQTPG